MGQFHFHSYGWSAVFGVVAILCLWGLVKCITWRPDDREEKMGKCMLLSFLSFILLVTGLITAFDRIKKGTIVVKAGTGEEVRRYDSFVMIPIWRRSDFAGLDMYVLTNTAFNVVMRVEPITENPKVRRIDYGVKVRSPYTVAGWRAFEKVVIGDSRFGDAETFLRFHLYNFNEAESKELAKLYNTLDPDQQAAFSKKVAEYVVEKLALSSLTFESAHFNLVIGE